jgi:hypothetical protein
MSTVTIDDLWSYISKTITSKSNDPFDDFWGTVIPVNKDGSFGEYMMVNPDGYEDIYDFFSHLVQHPERFETSSFGFMSPAWKRDPETGERVGKSIQFVLVRSFWDIGFGMWDLDTNELSFLSDEEAEEASISGRLPTALLALSLGLAIELNELGEAGEMMRKAKKMVVDAQELSAKAFEMLNKVPNH